MTLEAMSRKNEACYLYLIDSPINVGVTDGEGGRLVVSALSGSEMSNLNKKNCFTAFNGF